MVADAMTGQDAVDQARAFMQEVDLTGFILSKLDGDARGGAALSPPSSPAGPSTSPAWGRSSATSSRSTPTGWPSRILGMGDVLVAHRQGAEDPRPGQGRRGRGEDAGGASSPSRTSWSRCRRSRSSGRSRTCWRCSRASPGKAGLKDLQVDDREMGRAEAIIQSMTREERRESRYHRRVPAPADRPRDGATTTDVNALLKQFDQAKKMMKR